jgi:hypothetical protein
LAVTWDCGADQCTIYTGGEYAPIVTLIYHEDKERGLRLAGIVETEVGSVKSDEIIAKFKKALPATTKCPKK